MLNDKLNLPYDLSLISAFSQFQTLNDGKEPKKLMSLSQTRWLVWLPVSELVLEQWTELSGFFALQRADFAASELTRLMKDKSNHLYFLMMKSVLGPIQKLSASFEKSDADVTKLYSDLRSKVYSLAGRILNSTAIQETSRASTLRLDEIQMLKRALSTPANFLPADIALRNYGDSFNQLLSVANLSEDVKRTLQQTCGEYIVSLLYQLIERLPTNLPAVQKLKNLAPHFVLATVNRPAFEQLPLEFKGLCLNLVPKLFL